MLLSGLVYIKIFTHLPKIKEKIRYIFQIQKKYTEKKHQKTVAEDLAIKSVILHYCSCYCKFYRKI